MSRKTVLAVAVGLASLLGVAVAQQRQAPRQSSGQAGPLVEVFKTPTCGCCSQWVEHMRGNGFTVRTNDLNDLADIKKARGVPDRVQSCHTAVVNGYVVEGHVPAADVHRLLKEKPPVAGIAVGGMPIGSPGMEFPGTKAQAYDVMSFDKSGAVRLFARH